MDRKIGLGFTASSLLALMGCSDKGPNPTPTTASIANIGKYTFISVSISDMNGDNRPDIIIGAKKEDSALIDVYVLYNHGDGKYSTDWSSQK